MPNYVQLTSDGIVHTVCNCPSLNGINVIEVSECDPKYLGAYWDGSVFRKIVVIPDKTSLTVNEVININIQWVDVDGNPVTIGENVELICNSNIETVTITNGQGTTTFESEEPGEFIITAKSPAGVRADCRVVVS